MATLEPSQPPNSTLQPWIKIQVGTFTNWLNVQLEQAQMEKVEASELGNAFSTGVNLLKTLEVLMERPMHRKYKTKPRLRVQQVDNLNIALECIEKEGITLVNIGAVDLCDGNLKLVLGLIWTLIYHFQLLRALQAHSTETGSAKSAKDALLQWLQSKSPKKKSVIIILTGKMEPL
eukprot:m.40390 g.40390  ORF g.40390 m.40390 type:complete len:176 (+) comp9660_c0_seq2:78-605(+)